MIALTVISGIGSFLQSPPRPFVDHLLLHAAVHVDMFIFTAFVTAGVLLRGNSDAHKRLMLLTAITVGLRFPPLVVRVLLGISLPHYYEQAAYVLVAILYDLISRKRVHPVYYWGLCAFVIVAPMVEWLFRTVVPHLVVKPDI